VGTYPDASSVAIPDAAPLDVLMVLMAVVLFPMLVFAVVI
jgi:hypothetical protein